MNWVSITAIYFVIWWIVLFTMLPIGVRTQAEDDDITLGTDHGAPVRPRILRKMLLTTIVSLVVLGALYYLTVVLGLSYNDLPRVVPHFDK